MAFLKKITLVTHNADFHADDVFAAATLKLFLKKPVTIIRTRDEKLISTGDYVFDVGGEYDAEKNRFDHHQQGGAGKRENGIPYAAFGLVWKKFGAQVAGSAEIAAKIEERLVVPIDAHDNGVDVWKSVDTVKPFIIQNCIQSFLPTWKEPEGSEDTFFGEIIPIAEALLEREIKQAGDILEANHFVEEAYRNAADKRLLVLDQPYPFWEASKNHPEILFVVYPGKNHSYWKISTVQKEPGSFANRKDLPKAWAGKRDGELAVITGIPDVIFCHNGRFRAGAKSREGILKLAELALKN